MSGSAPPPAGPPPAGDWGGPENGRWGPRHGPYDRRHGRGRHSPWNARYPRPRPGWWPQDEPWPPVGDFPWRKVRRRFFVRLAIGVTIFSVLLIAGPIFVVSQVLSASGLSRDAYPAAAVIIVTLIGLALVGTARGTRRFAVPFGDLIEATGKVEAGDYSARVELPVHGIGEVRYLAESFNSMAARLEADEQQRRSLLADVSHELRTPLAVLRGELEAMIDGVHPMDEAHLTAAVDQIGMVTKLVEDLRTLALAEGGTLALRKEPTDLSILAQETAASFEGLASQGGVSFDIRMAPDMPLVDVDPLRVQEIIGNLVGNALRYAPRGSSVSLTGDARPQSVVVSVEDSGPGIDPEILPHLFERFAKGDDSRGSGLGLAIARRLVEAHGGTIKAERPNGGGTAIVFELPARSDG